MEAGLLLSDAQRSEAVFPASIEEGHSVTLTDLAQTGSEIKKEIFLVFVKMDETCYHS